MGVAAGVADIVGGVVFEHDARSADGWADVGGGDSYILNSKFA